MTDNILDSQTVRRLHEKAAHGESVTDDEMLELRTLASEHMAGFMDTLRRFDCHLRQREMDTCILVKLRFSPKELCNLFGMRASAVSNMRSRLYRKLYGEKGSSAAFDDRIRGMGS